MPHHYTASVEIAHPLTDLFAYFIRPKNLVQLAPSELNLELLTAPEILTLGSLLHWKGRRFGVSQQFTHEVSAFVRCRVPFRLSGEQVVSSPLDASSCH